MRKISEQVSKGRSPHLTFIIDEGTCSSNELSISKSNRIIHWQVIFMISIQDVIVSNYSLV
jgi:hypothetical protein